ncbi:hypothetical protein EI546_09530 [Aequorivita sp. H23M31]|uniref:Uncharacterized protein n=1 Tax=Aequorivita ciconiae TaxID=2494375 RepID=A0A410G3T3_9FLAO|nr:hypothetical protein [Aequorivita sp. H23M31]QAA81948.1 hypothetical protein EI546_09530 [Aequorivita sp. H23M31]
MNDILKYLIDYCAFLYNEYEFKFIDSYSSKEFNGQGLLILKNDILNLKFINDRGQLFLDFKGNYHSNENDWFSFDLIKQMLSPSDIGDSIMNKEKSYWLKENMGPILHLFSVENSLKTINKLKGLEGERANRMFGKIK